MKTGVARRTAIGWMTSIVPDAGADAAAAAEPGEHAPDGAGHGRRAAQHLDQRVARDGPGDEHRDGALEQVAEDDDDGPLATERAQGVGPARPPRADRAQVRPADTPGHDGPDRDRPEQVGHHDEHDRASGSPGPTRASERVEVGRVYTGKTSDRPAPDGTGRSIGRDGVASALTRR